MQIKKAIEISDAKIQFVSLVDKAANKRQFLITKAKDGAAQFSTLGKIVKTDSATHYLTGIVYEPLTEDAHGNFMTESEIKKAAYWFAKNGGQVDLQHSFESADGITVVENYITPCDMDIEGTPVVKGTWVMTVEVTNTDVWDAVQKGDITGFSMGGLGKYSEEDVTLENVSKDELNTPEKVGIFKKFAELLGINVIQKGAMFEAYDKSISYSNFWTAFYTLEDILYRYNWTTDCYEFESDETFIKEALTEFSTIITELLTNQNITKALASTAPIIKTSKKSSANQKKLDLAYQAFTELRKSFTEELEENIKKEENELTTQEVQKMIDTAIEKATVSQVTSGTDEPNGDGITEEGIQKMIDSAVAKALEDAPTSDTTADETVTEEGVQKMIDASVEKAVASLRQSRGLPSNLNGVKPVEKEADVFDGLFV